jgi:methionine biosynthesis protein MetW
MDSHKYYENYWASDGFHPTGTLWPELEDLYRANVTGLDRVLDVGCGDGLTSGMLLKEIAQAYQGVDVSSAAIAQATDHGFAAEVIEDASKLPFPDSSFDVVTLIEVLEHLFDPAGAVQEAARVLRPGGRLLATMPNIAYWRSRLDLLLVGRFNPRGDNLSVTRPWRDPHVRFFTVTSLTAMLQAAEFTDVRVGGHAGGVLNGMPWINQRLRQSEKSSVVYKLMEKRVPALFAYRLEVVAIR